MEEITKWEKFVKFVEANPTSLIIFGGIFLICLIASAGLPEEDD